MPRGSIRTYADNSMFQKHLCAVNPCFKKQPMVQEKALNS